MNSPKRPNAYDALLALPDDAPVLRDVGRQMRLLILDARRRGAEVRSRFVAERDADSRAA